MEFLGTVTDLSAGGFLTPETSHLVKYLEQSELVCVGGTVYSGNNRP